MPLAGCASQLRKRVQLGYADVGRPVIFWKVTESLTRCCGRRCAPANGTLFGTQHAELDLTHFELQWSWSDAPTDPCVHSKPNARYQCADSFSQGLNARMVGD